MNAPPGTVYLCFEGTMSTYKSQRTAVVDERGASVVPALIALGLDAEFIAAYYGTADAERAAS